MLSSRINCWPWCNSQVMRKQLVTAQEVAMNVASGERESCGAQGLEEICQQHLLATYYGNLFLWPYASLRGDVLAQMLQAALDSASALTYSLSETFLVKGPSSGHRPVLIRLVLAVSDNVSLFCCTVIINIP